MDFEPDFTCCMDASVPTCRYLNRPYAGADKDTFQYYMIDGFIVSDNITVNSFQTVDYDFVNSDHNPFMIHWLIVNQIDLLNEMEWKIGKSFKVTKAMIYRDHKNGFYVYAKPNQCNPKQIADYIGRYLGRPVIATKRIDKYDGENVTFHYNRHEDEKLIIETIPALEFIERLIQHIPEKHFKMVRYYGIYARHRECDKKLYRAISKEKHRIYLSFNLWRVSILHSFGYDPLKCPCCGKTMTVLEIYYNHKPVSLQELYERTMIKHHARPSPGSSSNAYCSML